MNNAANRQIMQEIFARVAEGDGSLFVNHLSDDVTMTITGQYSWSQTFRGKEEVLRNLYGYVRSLMAAPGKTLPFRFIADDEWVAVEARGEMLTKKGERYDNYYCLIYRLQNSKITEIREYQDSTLCEKVLGAFPGAIKKPEWIEHAARYAESWIDYRMKKSDQPGCVIAIAYGTETVLDKAFGLADLSTGEPMSPQHRFRVASLSKTFTAAGIFRLRELGKPGLDSRAGEFVEGLHPDVARITIEQLLTHSAGLTRDGANASFFADMRDFPTAAELMEILKQPPVLNPGQQCKYSNAGYGLLGLIIEAITGEPYTDWISREIIGRAGLTATVPDAGANTGMLAKGHTSAILSGTRYPILGTNETNAYACVTGFCSTASDIAGFYARLLPDAESGFLDKGSRYDMIRPLREDGHSSVRQSFGAGVHFRETAGLKHFGHIGQFQGTISRVATIPELNLTVAVLTNAIDGPAVEWVDGILHIIGHFYREGAPLDGAAGWNGRWWNLWGAVDLVASGSGLVALNPGDFPPFSEVSAIEITDIDLGRVVSASAMGSAGEAVSRTRNEHGKVTGIRIGGAGRASEETIKAMIGSQYGAGKKA